MLYNPYRELGGLADWRLVIEPLPAGQYGRCRWSDQTITIRPGLTVAHRRSVLAHELRHAHRGPALRHSMAREEAICDEQAARKLITIEALADTLAWTDSISEAADLLWTTPRMVQVRLDTLHHPAERAYLKRRLET